MFDKPIILIADDDPEAQWLLAGQLRRRKGFDVEILTSGTALLERLGALKVNNRPVAGVVTDGTMGADMNGIALIEKVHQRWPGMPMAMISAEPDYQKEAAARDVTFFDKAHNIDEVTDAIATIMGWSGPAPIDPKTPRTDRSGRT